MDPVLIPLVAALIALVSGLGGVVLGQRMARTTARQQIEAQERRDQELWAREDQHRFTDQKRVAYAELLAIMQRIGMQLSRVSEIQLLESLNLPKGERRDRNDPSLFAEVGLDREKARNELGEAASRVSLIAPETVTEAVAVVAISLQEHIAPMAVTTILETRKDILLTLHSIERLRTLMRAELVPGSKIHEVPDNPYTASNVRYFDRDKE